MSEEQPVLNEDLLNKIPYSTEQINLYHRLDAISDNTQVLKKKIIFTFFFLLFFLQLIIILIDNLPYNYFYTHQIFKLKCGEYLNNLLVITSLINGTLLTILQLLLAYVVYFLIVWQTKRGIIRVIEGNDTTKSNNKINILIKLISRFHFKFLFSIDSVFSIYYKEKLTKRLAISRDKLTENVEYIELKNLADFQTTNYKTDFNKFPCITLRNWNQLKIEKKFFIEWSNWLNVVVTIFIALKAYILFYLLPLEDIKMFVLLLLIYRVISRGIEICSSFYTDVVNENARIVYTRQYSRYYLGIKTSLIRSAGRLSLAIHSLIELIILYAAIYFYNSRTLHIGYEEFKILSPFESILFSTSLGVFNFSFNPEQKYFIFAQSFFHISQVVLSVILILLSIAQYLGGKDPLSKIDEDLYKEVTIKKTIHPHPIPRIECFNYILKSMMLIFVLILIQSLVLIWLID